MTEPKLDALPVEVMTKILQHLTHRELKAVNLVNRACWEQASAKLWLQLNSINPLFRLLTGRSVLPGPEARPQAWERDALMRRLPENLDHATWWRFDKYREFVRILYVGRCVFSPSLYASFWKAKLERELLPQLHTLFVSPLENQEWQWNPCANDVEDMLLLFLNSSVRRFASSCDQHAIVPIKILGSAPYIEELRLGASDLMMTRTECAEERREPNYDWEADENNKGVYVQNDISDWPKGMANLFPQWRLLSSLVVNGYFICTPEILETIARIPALTEFGICRPETEFWPDLVHDPALFPCLTKLSLWRAMPHCATIVLRCAPLLQRIASFVWDINRTFHLNNDKGRADAALCLAALGQLSSHPNSLNQVTISELATVPADQSIRRMDIPYLSIWSCAESIGLLAPFSLCWLHVDVHLHFLQYDATPMKALLSLGAQLSHLSMRGVIIPIQCFTIVADVYPALDYLRCRIDMLHFDGDFLKDIVPFPNLQQRDKSHGITLHLAIAIHGVPDIPLITSRESVNNARGAVEQLTEAWHPGSISLARDTDVEQCEHALSTMREMSRVLEDLADKEQKEADAYCIPDLDAEELRVEEELVVDAGGDINLERDYIVIDNDDDDDGGGDDGGGDDGGGDEEMDTRPWVILLESDDDDDVEIG